MSSRLCELDGKFKTNLNCVQKHFLNKTNKMEMNFELMVSVNVMLLQHPVSLDGIICDCLKTLAPKDTKPILRAVLPLCKNMAYHIINTGVKSLFENGYCGASCLIQVTIAVAEVSA